MIIVSLAVEFPTANQHEYRNI